MFPRRKCSSSVSRAVRNYRLAVLFGHLEQRRASEMKSDAVVPLRERESHYARWTDSAWVLRAAIHQDFATLRSMRAHGAVLEDVVVAETGETLLHMAATSGSTELAAAALGAGEPTQKLLDALSREGQAPLHVAITCGSEAVATLLIESRSDLEQRTGSGDTALIVACRQGATSIVRRLVEAAADVDVRTSIGDSAMQVAQARGHLECALLLGSCGMARGRKASKEGLGAAIPAVRPASRSSSQTGRHASLPSMPRLQPAG